MLRAKVSVAYNLHDHQSVSHLHYIGRLTSYDDTSKRVYQGIIS